MVRNLGLMLALLALACGGEEVPVPDDADVDRAVEQATDKNQPPLLEHARIVPREPTVGETLAVTVKAMDPDGDPVGLSVEWFRNGRSVKKGTSTYLKGSGFQRGDRIHAEITASDRTHETVVKTDVIRIANQLPTVTRAAIFPESPTGNDTLVVEALAEDGDQDALEFTYAWYVNDKELPGVTGASLDPGTAKRGDEVQVSVRASDGHGQGNWFRTSPVTIKNSAPVLTSDPGEATVGGGRYKYAVKAHDPDGDRPLRFSLVSGPPGLQVDMISGVVSWTVPQDAGGAYPIQLAVSDPYGGKTEHSYILELRWESEPAAAK